NATPATTGTANPAVIAWNHTIGLSKKPYLVVSVSIDRAGSNNPAVTSIVWGSEAGGPNQTFTTQLAAANSTTTNIVRAELWGLANPTPGTHQITVNVSNTGGVNITVVAGAKSFFNVFQTAPAGTGVSNTATSAAPSVVATNGALDFVVDAVAHNANTTLTATGGTSSFSLPGGGFTGGSSARTGTNNTTMSWTAGASQTWVTVACALKAATPQILFDAVSSTTFASAAAAFTGSWNHTTTNAANRYIVVGVNIDLSARASTISNVVYGTEGGGPNQAMTRLGNATNGTAVMTELWGLRNPATGTHQITVSVTNPNTRNDTVVAGAQSFSNVDQSTSTGTVATATGSSTTPTVNVTNNAADYVVDSVAFNTNSALTEGATQDGRYARVVTTLTNFSGAGSGSRGYVNTTMSWTSAASTNWSIVAIPLKPVTVGLTKTASADVIKLGDTVTYTLIATNYTAATVNGVTITDAIPAGATFVSQTGCSGTGPVTCNVGTLAANAVSSSYTITVIPNAAGTISNVATLTYTGAATAISSETVNVVAQGKVCATPGKDGVGGTLAGIKNDYWPGSASVAAGATGITIGARVAGAAGNTIAIGDLLVVMQMQDAAFDTTNDETYGEGTGSTTATGTGSGAATTLNNAGRWEYAIATNAIGAGGGALTIQGGGVGGGLLYSYTSQTFAATTTQGQRTFQVIRVPQYSTATLGSTLTALPWNGSTGGVLAVDVSGTLALGSATISVDGLGFRGGAGRILGGVGAGSGLLSTDFRTSATLAVNGSKGEGITGTPRYVYQSGATIGAPGANTALDTGVEGYVGGSYGRGAPGNSGGGSTDGHVDANDDNSGGGGGGNGGSGGAGGFGWNCRCPSGGQGGGGISPSLTRITMGGGGGAGTTNN
ncbi:MAG: beta strand repeat-containing protein, partial [Mycobacterium sp.]